MNRLIDTVVGRPRTTLLLLFMILLTGIASLRSIPVESDPSIAVPVYVIQLYNDGISAEDGERLLVQPLENELRSVEGVEEIRSYSGESNSTVVVEFDAAQDVDQALLDVREAVDRAKVELPSSTEEPVIQEQSTSDFPVLQVNLTGEDVPERMLYLAALDLRDRIEALPDVLEAKMEGHREEVLEVVIKPSALEAYQISGETLISVIARNNRLVPAGSLDNGEGRFSLKVPSVIETARDLYDLPVKTSADAVVTMADVADIKRSFKDRWGYVRVDGQKAISINVVKRANANIIDTVAATKEIVNTVRPSLPGKIDIIYTIDQAPWAELQVNELQGNILTALALVMIIVVAAMGFRSGIIVGLGIPMSLMFAVTVLYVIGFTYNFMVMFGMLLALGMLIDGAIVVTEYADRRMLEGEHRRQAYAAAAKRMFWPVVASIATTLAAFLPLMFWPGMVGKFMRYLPVTVFAVLSGSLLYALIFGPAIGALIGRPGADQGRMLENLKTMESGNPLSIKGFTGAYAKVLYWCSRHSFLTLTVTVSILFSSFYAYSQWGNGVIFYSNAEPQFAKILVKSPGNLSAREANAIVSEVEAVVLDVEGVAELQTFARASSGGDEIGTLFLQMLPENDRSRGTAAIFEDVRQGSRQIAGVAVEIEEMEQGPRNGKPIEIEIASFNRSLIGPALERVRAQVEATEGLVDIDDSLAKPGIEWRLAVDRARAAMYGADVTQVGVAVQLITTGIKIGEYRPDRSDDAVDIRIRYPDEDRGIKAIDTLRVSTVEGMVPISNFVTTDATPNVGTLRRYNGIPVDYVRSNVATGVLADTKVKELQAWLKTQNFDPGVQVNFRGADEEQQESQAFTATAFGLSLLLMFVLLVTQFNSFYQSALILFAVVMSTAGVLLGLLITGNPFSSLLTGIGIVALAGIVVNNNIVLIDTFNELRRDHPAADPIMLIVRTGTQRLRPVVLTTLTTVFGLLPLAMNFSVDMLNRSITYGSMLSSLWVPLSQAIVSGMAFASLLTLIATPAMLALPYRVSYRKQQLSARLKGQQNSVNRNSVDEDDKTFADEVGDQRTWFGQLMERLRGLLGGASAKDMRASRK